MRSGEVENKEIKRKKDNINKEIKRKKDNINKEIKRKKKNINKERGVLSFFGVLIVKKSLFLFPLCKKYPLFLFSSL